MLKPLQEWICDGCGEVIEKPQDGWVGWYEEDGKFHGFEIIHHVDASPRGGRSGCCKSSEGYPRDAHLRQMLGARGMVVLLSLLDVGTYHDPKGDETIRVRNVREWRDLFMRLTIPHYEEARRCLGRAWSDSYSDCNELVLYLPDTLKAIIEEYGNGAGA